ncbi:MAG: glycosyltransferase family 39 protein, partial [Bacteroidetes bacterium]|nr:glycosyltransferase family 39 protein [Bacteroidota bacterium]
SPFIKTANNHLLNTWLIRQSTRLSGSNSELALRFPNVLAFLVYGIAVWLILKPWKNNPLLYFSGCGLLLLNPYMIDFFSLARGYGLALAFGLMAIYFFVKAREPGQMKYFARDFFFSLLFSLLAAWSNFILINLNIALLALYLLEFLMNSKKQTFKENIPVVIGLLLILGLNIHHINKIYDMLMVLKDNKELYIGSNQGFIESTLRILIHRSIYLSYYGEQFWLRLYHGLLIGFFSLNIVLVFRAQYTSLSKVFSILLLMIAASVLQYYLFEIPYPVERTSLIFIPLTVLTVFMTGAEISDWLSNYKPWAGLLVGGMMLTLIVLPLGYHFYQNLNTHYAI